MNSLLLALALIGASPAFEVQTLNGKALSGSLQDLSSHHIIVDTRDGRVSLDTANVLSISAKHEATRARPVGDVIVELTDGSTVYARQCEVKGAVARITFAAHEPIETPTTSVRTVQLQRQSDALDAEWLRLAQMKTDSDVLVVRKGASLDYLTGVMHDATEDVVRFEVDGETLPIKRSKVYGLAFRRAGAADLPVAICRITDAAGSQWSARSVKLAKTLQWTTPSGLTMAEPLDKIAKVDFSNGKIAYLSDLKPDSSRWTPYFSAGEPPAAVEHYFAPRFDHTFDGRTLQLGGISYPKGLALHSRTELVYRLPERFKRFQAVAGIDDATGPGGKVRLVIRGDDKQLLDLAISGSDAPRPIELDLSGVRRLTIVVDFGDGFSTGNYLLLCNARLSK